VEGHGHLFVAATGVVFFLDYSTSKLVGSPNFDKAIACCGNGMDPDDIAPFIQTTQNSPSTMGSLDLNTRTGIPSTVASGRVGIEVTISGIATTGISNLDQSCPILSPSDRAIIVTACAINGDDSTSGNFTCSFTVGNVPPGEYVIEVTACPGNNGCAPSQ